MKKLAAVVSVLILMGFATPAFADESTPMGSDRCSVRSWEITWGFKESFRSYLSGTIARGGWETDGNISYDTPFFTLAGTSGFLGPEGDRGEVSGYGSITFSGHEGFLDQRVSAPKLVIESANRAALYFAVVGDTQEGVTVDEASVRFAEVNIVRYSVDPGAGVWSVVSAPVVLTAAGAEAFGTYPAGEPLDSMDIAIRVGPGCLERDNLVAIWLLGTSAVIVLSIISYRVWRRLEGNI